MKKERKLLLILGSHAHVPSGSSECEFEFVYENVMRPFIANLYRYSNVQAVLHYSGVLLYWVERTHPEFFMLIEDMVTRKQAELLSGGFYEPMFPIIPQHDRIGQIELLTTYLRKHFGKRPLGCWIPEMAWEQNIAASLSASDMQYTFLSQDQFLMAGMSCDELYFPCITEDQGRLVTVYPVSKTTEKDLSCNNFSHVFVELKKQITENQCLSKNDIIISVFPEKVFSDPNEAPDTAWNRFFEEVSLSENIIETIIPSKIIKTHKAVKKASFPNSASVNGFSPRRYLIDTCEANGIYSKMIFTGVLVNQLKGDKYRKQSAREELWKAQDSRLFSPANGQKKHKLRKAAYSSLLRAEQLSREKGKFISSLIPYDFDFDGKVEYLFQDLKINCYIQLKGAGLFELDYLPTQWNYLDCGSVSYDGITEERRISFADALLPPESKTEDLMNGFGYLKNARLCFNEQYDASSQDRKGKSCFKMNTSSDKEIPFNSIEINKCYSLKKDVLNVSYLLKNTAKDSVQFCFVPEIDFSFADVTDDFVRFYSVDENTKDSPIECHLKKINTLKILDVKNEVQILLVSTIAFSGCLIPVLADGLYQATRILPLFNISLEGGKSWANEFSLKFSH